MEELQRPRVPGYAVGRLLGRGGSSSVWLAKEERTGREFALKCFCRPARRAARGEAMTEEGIRREIRILSVLDHPHLIRAHSAVAMEGGADGTTALIMDYAPAGSLGDLVAAKGKLNVGETVTVLTPIAQVLGYLHSKGFTHSDVSPGNVLFTTQGKPMLSDVGIARMLGDPASAPGRGTQGFMDPAPVDAVRAGLQPERDVYAVAALGWFCLTGSPPPRTADRPPLTLLLPEVPKELAAALESGLNEDRRLRPTAPALGTAVYRSASPLPLDLASAVHPTVLPELVTRLHGPAAPSGLHEKVQGLRRRLATSKWSRLFTGPQKLPFPASHPALPAVEQGKGRHAQPQRGLQVRRGAFAAAAVGAVVAGCWLTGAGVTAAGPGSAPAGDNAATAAATPETQPVAAPQADPAEAARQQAGSPDPAIAVQGLSSLRSLAFSSGRLDLLAEVNQPGSAAAAADQQIRQPLQASGHTLAGFATTLSQVQAEEGGTPERAVVAVTSASSAYEEKDAQGAVVATGAPGAEQRLRVVLLSIDGRWRVSDILPGS
jgi:serine/threonine protein kinase